MDAYTIINPFFDSLTFYYVDHYGPPLNTAIYAARINSYLVNEKRYILLSVPASKTFQGVGTPIFYPTSTINNLKWDSLQTISTQKDYMRYESSESAGNSIIPSQKWSYDQKEIARRTGIEKLLFVAVSRKDDRTSYVVMYSPKTLVNFRIELMNDKTKKTIYQYNEKMSLSAALETYACSIVLQQFSFTHPEDGDRGGMHNEGMSNQNPREAQSSHPPSSSGGSRYPPSGGGSSRYMRDPIKVKGL